MSEETGKAVLLPSARVALHVRDAEIREAAKSLAADWRFARVSFDVREGSIETAIETYRNQPSPELVIVETSTIEKEFTERLEILAGNCSDSTSAVVVGPVNDVYLYRKLIDMGVSDYLVRPVTVDVLAQVISKTLLEKFGASDSRLVAVVGAKGGVGTSLIAGEIARSASSHFDEKTMILDAAGGWSYLSVNMGTEPMTSLAEITRLAASSDEAAFNRMVYNVSPKLSVLATGADTMLDDHITAEGFEAILNRLVVTYPLIVADLSGAPAAVQKTIIARANDIIVVSTPTLPSLRAARALIHEIKSLRGDSGEDIELVVNKSGESPGFEISRSDIDKAMEQKPSFIIQYDDRLFFSAEAQGKSLQTIKGGEGFAAGLADFVRKILGAKDVTTKRHAEDKLLNGLLSKLKGRKG